MTGRELIDRAMIQDGQTDSNLWLMYFSHFKDFCQFELNNTYSSITTIEAPVEQPGVVKWPADYLSLVSIGVREGDRVRRLIGDGMLAMHTEYDQEEEEVSLSPETGGIPLGPRVETGASYLQSILSPLNGRVRDRFREDPKNRRFVLCAEYPHPTVYLEYLASQDIPDESSIIHHDAQKACLRYMQWKVRSILPAYHQYEINNAERLYNAAYSQMRIRTGLLTPEAIMNAIRGEGGLKL